MLVAGALGFVRWAEPLSPEDTCLYPVRVTSVLASGSKFHCEFIGCGGQRTTEPLAATSFLAGDDEGYTGLGSANVAGPGATAQCRDDPAAANCSLALPTGEPRSWRICGEGTKKGAHHLTPSKKCCVVSGPIDVATLRATGNNVVSRIRTASKEVGCPVHVRTSNTDRDESGELRLYLKCGHGAAPRATSRLESVTAGTTLTPKLVSAAATLAPQSTGWRAVVAGRATDVSARSVGDLGIAALRLIEDFAGAGAAVAAAADPSTIPSALHGVCSAVTGMAAFSQLSVPLACVAPSLTVTE